MCGLISFVSNFWVSYIGSNPVVWQTMLQSAKRGASSFPPPPTKLKFSCHRHGTVRFESSYCRMVVVRRSISGSMVIFEWLEM